jgi:hypothetical protein
MKLHTAQRTASTAVTLAQTRATFMLSGHLQTADSVNVPNSPRAVVNGIWEEQ